MVYPCKIVKLCVTVLEVILKLRRFKIVEALVLQGEHVRSWLLWGKIVFENIYVIAFKSGTQIWETKHWLRGLPSKTFNTLIQKTLLFYFQSLQIFTSSFIYVVEFLQFYLLILQLCLYFVKLLHTGFLTHHLIHLLF